MEEVAQEAAKPTGDTNATRLTAEQYFELGRAHDTKSTEESEAFLGRLQGFYEKPEGEKGFSELRVGDKEASRISEADIKKLENLEHLSDADKTILQRRIAQIRAIDLFNQVNIRAQREGVPPQQILRELGNNTQWVNLQRTVLDILAAEPAIREAFKGKSEGEIRKTILEAVVSDPKYGEAFAQLFKTTVARLDTLTKPKEPEGLKEEKKKRDRFKEVHENLRKSLSEDQALAIDETDINDILKRYVSGEISEESVESFLQEAFERRLQKENISPQEQVQIAAIVKAQEQAENCRAQIADLEAERRGLDPKSKSYSKDTQSIDRQLSSLRSQENTYKQKAKHDKTIDGKIDSFKFLKDRIIGTKQGETIKSPFSSRVKELIRSYSEYIKAEDRIESLEQADKDYQKQKAIRELEEADFIEQLEAIFNDSIVDLIDKREEKWSKPRKEMLSKEQDEELKKVGDYFEKIYIEFDPNKRREIHHRVKTGEHMRLLARYGKNDGLRLMAAEALGYGSDSTKWTKDQITHIDNIVSKKGADMYKKLFVSYFKERTFFDKSFRLKKPFSKEFLFDGGVGDLTITEAEWDRLRQDFSSEIEAGLSASKEAQNFLKGLKEKGVNPNWNLKWLLWILIILGIIGGIAAFKH